MPKRYAVDHLADAELRQFDRPTLPAPEEIQSVYLIGICGTGMGSLAGLIRQSGRSVRGSDSGVYPPMSTYLERVGITIDSPYAAANLDADADLVVVGNACTPRHEEATRARDERRLQASFPETLAHLFLQDRKALVLAGTHGKTTSTAMLVHLLRTLGQQPSYLIGGVPADGTASFSVGDGAHFVIEGDEYDSAYFDKRPKFLHYRPHGAVITSVEWDHLDIYATPEDYVAAFEDLVDLIPSAGHLVIPADTPHGDALAGRTGARVTRTAIVDVLPGAPSGAGESAIVESATGGRDTSTSLLAARIDREDQAGIHISLWHSLAPNITYQGTLPVVGRHNVLNALNVLAIAWGEGLALGDSLAAMATFAGMKRRAQVLLSTPTITVVDDFAHHPTAVKETLQGLRHRFSDRRLVAVFEPRSNSSRRRAFEAAYIEAFTAADLTLLQMPAARHNDRPEDFIRADRMIETLQERGHAGWISYAYDDLYAYLMASWQPGDVILFMSNGAFGGLPSRFAASVQPPQR